MNVKICKTPNELGIEAGKLTAKYLLDAIKAKGQARLLLSTGASQFETLEALRSITSIDWDKVEIFHLDEYIGIDENHKASFVKYLKERFISKLGNTTMHYIYGNKDPKIMIQEVSKAINKEQIDIALIGIGENAHIAFNDPPADFDSNDAYKVVNLDDACKDQQVREGWFENRDSVPKQAISMTVNQILKSKVIISCVPHAAKADAIKKTFDTKLSNLVPSSILKTHPEWFLFLDEASSSKVDKAKLM